MAEGNTTQFLAKTVGLHGHWGLSSTFDFAEALGRIWTGETVVTSPVRVLLVHPGDVRHIITTMCRLHRAKTLGTAALPEFHFYLLENPVDILCRDLLLLQLLLDFKLPIRQRATIFLEVYGNLKVQRRTSAYIEELGNKVRLLMAQCTDEAPTHILNFSMLNHRQRDEVEEGFKLYDRLVGCDIDEYFDHRKRALYEDRYDGRKALHDWDYQSSLQPKASIIHIKLYKEWRESGIAYQFGDQTYSETNRTLISYTEGTMKGGKDKGARKAVRGYWGDVVCSPYFAFGVDCETPNRLAEGLFEIYNKKTGTEQHRHHAVEVALHSLFSLLFELEHECVYAMTKANDVFSGLGDDPSAPKEAAEQLESKEGRDAEMEPIIETEESEEPVQNTPGPATEDPQHDGLMYEFPSGVDGKLVSDMAKALMRADSAAHCLSRVKVFPMAGTAKELIERRKLRGTFDAVFVSCRAAEVIGHEGFTGLLRRPAEGEVRPSLVAVETAKFLVPFQHKNQAAVAQKIDELAQKSHLMKIAPPVSRRRRDEEDKEDDVLFFTTQ